MKKIKLHTIIVVLLSLLLTTVSVAAITPPEAPSLTSNKDADRFVALTKEIRCIVCENQNLAESTAPIANDLRQKIYTMILEKKSDSEIKDYLVKRYGEFILLKPRFTITTLFLWLFPFIGIAGILWYILRSTPELQTWQTKIRPLSKK